MARVRISDLGGINETIDSGPRSESMVHSTLLRSPRSTWVLRLVVEHLCEHYLRDLPCEFRGQASRSFGGMSWLFALGRLRCALLLRSPERPIICASGHKGRDHGDWGFSLCNFVRK
jgi:hypothetical protein